MKIIVDENIPLVTVASLRERGHDVFDVRGTIDQGVEDAVLWRIAQQEERLLISTDKGFAQHRHEAHHGVLIVRLRQPNRQRIHDRVMQGMDLIPENEWGSLLVTMRDHLHSVWRSKDDPSF